MLNPLFKSALSATGYKTFPYPVPYRGKGTAFPERVDAPIWVAMIPKEILNQDWFRKALDLGVRYKNGQAVLTMQRRALDIIQGLPGGQLLIPITSNTKSMKIIVKGAELELTPAAITKENVPPAKLKEIKKVGIEYEPTELRPPFLKYEDVAEWYVHAINRVKYLEGQLGIPIKFSLKDGITTISIDAYNKISEDYRHTMELLQDFRESPRFNEVKERMEEYLREIATGIKQLGGKTIFIVNTEYGPQEISLDDIFVP